MESRIENKSKLAGDSQNPGLQASGDWPGGGKESLNACPVCGGLERSVVHPELTDRIFFCAPGAWAMHRCDTCHCGYLDPRPTPETIGLAYAEYYTHAAPQEEVFLSSSTFVGRRLAFLRNGYLNARFPRLALQPSLHAGFRLLGFCPETRALAERDVRHLPTPGAGATLLDIGCGSGAFVRRALGLGYAAEGLEFDAQAVGAAAGQGLPVREGSLPDTGLPQESFDAVTLSQVIEHLHNPMAALAEIFRLLKPGGFFWLATPNMDAPGHVQFGPDWRGLEPPRHLVLFSAKALALAMEQVGFIGLEFKPPGAVSEWFYTASHRIATHVRPGADITLPAHLAGMAYQENRLSLADPVTGEELVVIARKPS
jgi:2-polyprenyl-3-methyl-5-hydroxy-6-metoxy-1,4-benzoquinol methylase